MCILDYADDRTMPLIHVSIAIFLKYFVLSLPFTDDFNLRFFTFLQKTFFHNQSEHLFDDVLSVKLGDEQDEIARACFFREESWRPS